MMALLSPRFWVYLVIMAALAVSHGMAYRSGKVSLRADWDKAKAEQIAAALITSETFRLKESALNASNLKVTNDYIAQKKRAADAAVVSAGKLSELQAAVDSAASESARTAGGVDAAAFAISRECAGALTKMDGYAANLAGQVTGLQGYARLVRGD